MSNALAILGDGYTITITPEAIQQKKTIVEASRRIIAVTDQDSCDIAQSRLKALANVRIAVDKSRELVKRPVLELGRTIDGIAREFAAEIVAEETRLDAERAAAEAQAQQQAAVAIAPAMPTGVKEEIDFEVLNIIEFAGKFPQLVTITPKRADILAALKKSFARNGKLPEVAGLRVFQNLKVKSR